jgi:CheY-specific phosphatase CheX
MLHAYSPIRGIAIKKIGATLRGTLGLQPCQHGQTRENNRNNAGGTRVAVITFEQIVDALMSATKETFLNYMGIELITGEVEKRVAPVDSDITGIVGVAGDRVGYILVTTDSPTARFIAKELLMDEEADDESIRDAVGELTNNIAGCLKSKYHEQYGGVALGLPLVVSGRLRMIGDNLADQASINIQCKGITIPFSTADGNISLKVMIYM